METSDIIAICAAFIALSSTGIGIWQGYLNRQHFRLSVKPHITITSGYFNQSPISYSLCNDGLGPAIIKKYSICINEEDIEIVSQDQFKEVFNKLNMEFPDFKFLIPTKGEAYISGKNIKLLELFPKENTHEEVLNKLDGIKFKILYSSIYNDKVFTYHGNS